MPTLSKGTFLYFIDPADQTVVRYYKPKSIPALTAPRTEIDITSVEDDGPQYLPGDVAPGESQILTDFDPAQPSHARALALYEDDAAPIIHWAIGWPGATTEPVALGSLGAFDEGALARRFTYFDGYIKDLPPEFQVGQFITANLTIKRSGRPRFVAAV